MSERGVGEPTLSRRNILTGLGYATLLVTGITIGQLATSDKVGLEVKVLPIGAVENGFSYGFEITEPSYSASSNGGRDTLLAGALTCMVDQIDAVATLEAPLTADSSQVFNEGLAQPCDPSGNAAPHIERAVLVAAVPLLKS